MTQWNAQPADFPLDMKDYKVAEGTRHWLYEAIDRNYYEDSAPYALKVSPWYEVPDKSWKERYEDLGFDMADLALKYMELRSRIQTNPEETVPLPPKEEGKVRVGPYVRRKAQKKQPEISTGVGIAYDADGQAHGVITSTTEPLAQPQSVPRYMEIYPDPKLIAELGLDPRLANVPKWVEAGDVWIDPEVMESELTERIQKVYQKLDEEQE